MRAIFALTARLTGKRLRVDQDIPMSLLVWELLRRAIWLLRGLIRTRRLVFVGPSVRLHGKSHLILDKWVTIETGCTINAYGSEGIKIGTRSKIGAHSILSVTNHLSRLGRGITIGRDSAIGQYSFIGARGSVAIGNDVIMGQYVSFHASNHTFSDPSRLIREQPIISAGIEISDDVWVGAKATFTDGSSVGPHSVVAAGAVITSQFGANSLIGGVPARLIRGT